MWWGLLDDRVMGTLARHAVGELMRPLSSAACERVFSYLTQMDSFNSRNSGAVALQQELFLRGNNEALSALRDEWFATHHAKREEAAEESGKLRILERQLKATQAALRATQAAATPHRVRGF